MVLSWQFWATAALALSPFVAGAGEQSIQGRNETTEIEAGVLLHCKHKEGYLCFDHCFDGGQGSCAAYFESKGVPPKTIISTVTNKDGNRDRNGYGDCATDHTADHHSYHNQPVNCVFSTISASTMTRVETVEVIQTITLAPETLILATTTPSPVTACPAPTAAALGAPRSSSFRLKWGCEPGYVCSPPKPEGCNAWGSCPPKDYVCEPQYCRPAPPPQIAPETSSNETGWVPPNPFYFNLDPTKFGLTGSIFEKYEIIQVVEGRTITVTTGDWTPHASVAQATAAPGNPGLHMYKPRKRGDKPIGPRKILSWKNLRNVMKHAKRLYRRQNGARIPERMSICYTPCNAAFIAAQDIGLVPRLCVEGSSYQDDVNGCWECLDLWRNETQTGNVREYVGDQFEEYLAYCDVNDGTVPPSGPQSIVSTEPGLTSASQGGAVTSGAPIPISSTLASASDLTSDSSSATTLPSITGPGPTPTGSSPPSTTATPRTTPSVPVVSTTPSPPTVTTAGAVFLRSSPANALLLTLLAVIVGQL
ncbi:hypothetical protein OOU_Y34scaffold00192g12 [Pyricularia oryzae Y34]|uniref:Uncharacterized protein n=2 Tax=Pyricularia oryzae TaxID=318829 RepID=A0AA97PQ45_PYRO3|nr:hypothetical protein OOU_Y34scaffold00192g12 [Pyricularia oryzae Y34]